MPNPDLSFLLRSLSRCVYVVTDEEDRFLVELQGVVKSYVDQTWVWSQNFGLVPLNQRVRDWTSKAHQADTGTMNVNEALIKIYKDDSRDKQHFYVFLDPERILQDPMAVRRILEIIHQGKQDIQTIKILIFVGNRRMIPDKLSRYMEVVQDPGLDAKELADQVVQATGALNIPVPPDPGQLFKGLTSYEVGRVVSQSVVRTKKERGGPRIDPHMVAEFRRNQIRKTDLVTPVQTELFPFSVVGGVDRFKDWATKTKAAWTEEGRNFGLTPPRGVLCVGVWGCGKSLSVKALGNAWGLPVIQFEMGRLRSSGVGDSEANVYRALRIVESVAPALLWVDEAEKSLSGGASSEKSDAGTTSRTIGILSTWLQETTSPVCLALTANSLETLPIEFVNRADERFFFSLPSETERVDILKIHLQKNQQDSGSFDLASLSELAKGLVGREIEQAIKAGMTESYAARKSGLDEAILSEVLRTKPRILKTMSDEVKALEEWVGYDPENKEGIRARFASSQTISNNTGGALRIA